MKHYKSIRGDSGIDAYDFDTDSVTVRFTTGASYTYTNESTGRHKIAQMKRLAQEGSGLATFISRHVGGHYSEKSPATPHN